MGVALSARSACTRQNLLQLRACVLSINSSLKLLLLRHVRTFLYSAMMPRTLQTAAEFIIDLEKKSLCLELASILQTLTLPAGCQQVALSAPCQLQAGEVNSPVAAATGRRTNLLHSVPRWAGHLISDPGCGWGLACLVQ